MALSKDNLVKNEIVESARKLFSRFGLKKTTMDEIAAACGKAKSTLYHYYKSKEEVFGDVILTEMTELRKQVEISVKQQISLREKFKAYFFTYHKGAMNNENLLSIIKKDMHTSVVKTEWFNQLLEYEINYLSVFMQKGLDKGELTGITKEEIPWFAEILLISFMGIVKHNIEKEGVFDEFSFFKIADVLINRIIV